MGDDAAPHSGGGDGGFAIRSERRGPTHRIAASGAVVGPKQAHALHNEFYRALASDAATIVVDLSAVTAFDRAAVNTLTFMRRRAGRPLRIIPSGAVAEAVRGLADSARGG